MGLDITAYEKVELIPPHERERGEEPPCYERLKYGGLGHVTVYVDYGFEHALGSLQRGACYLPSGETLGFRAGSYSGYNSWREQLCEAALGVAPNTVWTEPERWQGQPFYHLVNFSDCEGSIGPEVCAVLASEFAQHAERMKGVGVDRVWFAEKYGLWHAAFKLAMGSGLVQFH